MGEALVPEGGFGGFWHWRRVLGVVFVAAVAAVGAGTAYQQMRPQALTLPVQYQLRTQVNSGSGCAGTRTFTGVYGVPLAVNVSGGLVPDLSVTVLPVPSVGTAVASSLSVYIDRLSSRALPIRVEAIISPGGSADPSRLSFGYDTCDSNAPSRFHSVITSEPSEITVSADDSSPGTSLTILGSAYSSVNGVDTNPTRVASRFAPVPSTMRAVVEVLGNSRYAAHVYLPAPSMVTLDYLQQSGSSATSAHIVLNSLPKQADVTFSSTSLVYTMSSVIHDTIVDVKSAAAGHKTIEVLAHVVDLPTSASLVQDGPTHATFSTPTSIGDATVRFASYDPGTVLPAQSVDTNQFLNAVSRPQFLVADVRVKGFSSAVADWGDPIRVDFTHTAGPFDFLVDTGSLVASGKIADLPGRVTLNYEPRTEAVGYTGSAVINSLIADVQTADPLAGRAHQGHLVAAGIPTGLSTVLNSGAQTFSATLSGGTLGSIELQLTNGADLRLPAGTDGLLFHDPADPNTPPPPGTPYVVFVRATNVSSASVGWGDPLSGDLRHTPAQFVVDVLTNDFTISGTFNNLPATVHFSLFTPPPPVPLPPGTPRPPTATKLVYTASDAMDAMTLDIVRSTAFTNTANHIHVKATGLPGGVTLNIDPDHTNINGNILDPGIGQLEVQLTDVATLCATGDCLAAGTQGVRLIDQISPKRYNAFVRINGLSSPTGAPLLFNWGDTVHGVPIQANIAHTAGPLVISVVRQSQPAQAPNDPIQNPDVINTQTVEGTVSDLPHSVSFSYLSSTNALTYHGSAAIAKVSAVIKNDTEYIGGRAYELDLDLTGVPTDVTLGIDMSNIDNRTFTADAGGGSIGKVELLLTDGQFDDRIELGSSDGVLIKDMSPDAEYNVFVRINGLQHVDFVDRNQQAGLDYEAVTEVHTTLLGGQPLRVNLENKGTTNVSDPNLKPNNLEYLNVSYASPPPKNHFKLERVAFTQDDLTKGKTFATEVTYDGAGLDNAPMSGGALDLTTNKGAYRTLLEVKVDSVPSSVFACLAPSSYACAPAHHNGAYSDPVSYDLDVSSPMHMAMVDCTESPQFIPNYCNTNYPIYSTGAVFVDLNVSSHLAALKEVQQDDCTPDCDWVAVDTNNTLVSGSVEQGSYDGSGSFNRDLKVGLPDGFMAGDRYGQLSCPAPGDCSGHYMSGKIACPPGTDLIVHTGVGDIQFRPEYCTTSNPQSASPTSAAQGQVNVLVDLYGTDFSPGWNVYLGKRVGTFVAIDSKITVTQVEWIDYYHIRFHVTVDAADVVGTRDIILTNPTNAYSFCNACFSVTQ